MPRAVARVVDPGSGRLLTVSSTERGLQFYTGNFFANVPGWAAAPYAPHNGFCLAAQVYPNQINGPEAEAVVLRAGHVSPQNTI